MFGSDWLDFKTFIPFILGNLNIMINSTNDIFFSFFHLRFSYVRPSCGRPLCFSVSFLPQGGSMPNTSSSVPFLLSSSMQSIRSRRTSTVLTSGPLGSGSGLLQQLGSGMVRQLTGYGGGSGAASPVQQSIFNGNSSSQTRNNYVRKCPSLNITFSG